mgnify:CR=1 FL=1
MYRELFNKIGRHIHSVFLRVDMICTDGGFRVDIFLLCTTDDDGDDGILLARAVLD